MNQKVKSGLLMLILLSSAAFLASGCVEKVYPKKKVVITRPEKPPAVEKPLAVPEELELLRQAELAHSHARWDEALEKYQAFLKAYPDSTQADSAWAAVGQIQEKRGQIDQAVSAYEKLTDQWPQSRFVDEARRRLARLYLDQGQPRRSAKMSAELLKTADRPEEKARLRLLLGRAHQALQNRDLALDLYLKAYGETTDPIDKDEAQRRIPAVIGEMNLEELARAHSRFGTNYPGGMAAYFLAYRSYKEGRTEEAGAALDFFLKNFPGHALQPEALALKTAMAEQKPAPPLALGAELPLPTEPVIPPESVEIRPGEEITPRVGPPLPARDVACLLPLSGNPAAQYGQSVLTGLKLAFKTYQPRTPGFSSNLAIYDTKGDPEAAVQVLEKLAGEARIMAVVGPLVSKVAMKAAPKAEELAVPMITISQLSGVTGTGLYVLRLFLTPQAQVQAVARYVIQVLGLSRLAILHPSDAYGQKMRDYFREEVQKIGGEIVSIEAYDPAAKNFDEAVQRLAGVGKAQRRVVAGRKVSVGFDAVFLPDTYEAVAMIAPQFPYHDITAVRLLGTSLWHTPKMLYAAARYIQRCIFPTAFFPGDDRPEVQRFVQAYRAEVGDEEALPGQFEAYGYEAGALLLTLLDNPQVSSRQELVQALHNLGPFSGVTGRFSFSADGEYQSEPVLLSVEGDEFVKAQ